jgi:hypothetical protein
MVDRMAFTTHPTVMFDGGRVSGFRYSAEGRRVSRKRVDLAAGATAHASAWAVINGVAHFRIIDGPLGGRWVPETQLRLSD